MKRWLAGVVLLLLTGSVLADETVTLTCTLPTLNEDGTPLTDLAGTRYYEANVTGGPYVLVYDETDPTLCGTVLERTAGTYFYVATAYNVPGVESAYSGEAVKVVPPPAPAPPTNLVVEPGNLVAYAISQTENIIVTYPVGTVPEGTSCDSTMQVNGKYVVPRATVNWVGTARPLVIFAACV